MIKRRTFLESSIATLTTLASGCRSDGNVGIDTDATGSTGTGESTGTGTASSGDVPDTDTETEGEPLPPRDAEASRELFPQSVASGDPTAGTVILWTRIVDPELDGDATLELELFADDTQSELLPLLGGRHEVQARAAFDHCTKVRLEGLAADTTYFYRFVYARDGRFHASPLGRTRTAPAPDADVPVRFAFVSCQDFIGRYYNAYAHLAEQDLAFFVHLGDYIYETTGDASFQSEGGERSITFDDPEGAITLGSGPNAFQAARSLDNYRQLHRTYRSDAALQRVHERFPMVAIWDDHEFSDDCHGATATYLDGRADETDPARRRAANQAWFEYMPVDYREPDFEYDPEITPPDDIAIHRDLTFGRHLRLVMTDLRSRRTDHLIPEDAYPGTVIVDEATLLARGALPAFAAPYVPDIDAFADGLYADVLRAAAAAASYPVDRIAGPISATWINLVVAAVGNPELPAIADEVLATLPRGLAYLELGKSALWDSLGSRYVVLAAPFELWSAIQYERTKGASEDLLGAEQEAWFLDTMRSAEQTWKVWGTSFCLSPLQIDLSAFEVPALFRNRLLLNVEDWNGVRNRRNALLGELSAVGNVVAITGDIHAFFASVPGKDDDSGNIVEFVTGSVSSGSFSSLLRSQARSNPVLSSIEGIESLIDMLPAFLSGTASPNPHLAFANTEAHGYAIVEVDGAVLHTTYHAHATALVTERRYDDPALGDVFTTLEFRVQAGQGALERRFGTAWTRWNPETRTWD